MNLTEFTNECISAFSANGLPCSASQAEKLYILTEHMLTVNKSMNLTAITDEKAVILRHYIDSLTISEHIPEGAKIIDVGCGAGFPSLPLAVFRPDLRITALDSTAKRIRYVEETAALLGLNNLTAIAARAEEYAHKPEFRESFDIATARAVANLSVLCELCLPYVKVGGKMIAMKSKQAPEELDTAKNCISLCGGKVLTVISRDLISDMSERDERNLVIIEKSSKCPNIYPRHFSKISKKPL